MTNEELDNAREIEAIRIYDLEQGYLKPHGLARIAARLVREGWTPPAPVDPEVGSIWKHYNGNVYEVIAIANTLDTEKYPKAVIHKNRANGTVWTRRADDWHRSYTQQAKTSEPSVDPDIAIAKQIDAPNSTRFHLAFTAIKRGRALAAEAKPGLVWLKHDGSGECPISVHQPVLITNINGFYGEGLAGAFYWNRVTHYAEITPPEDVA